jgi:hypothetical protein
MITETDIKGLRRSTSRSTRVVLLVAFCVCILAVAVCGTLNLRLAHRYAQASGSSLAGMFIDDVDIRRDYPGTYLIAYERLGVSVMEFVATMIALVQLILAWSVMNRNARILRFIEQHRPTEPCAGDGRARK